MSLFERFGIAHRRIATAKSVIRTREDDAQRAELQLDVMRRLEPVVTQLEQVADELEKALV